MKNKIWWYMLVVVVLILMSITIIVCSKRNDNNNSATNVIDRFQRPLKIFNLILYSPESEYDQMRDILDDYLTKKNIPHLFYMFDETLDTPFVVKDNILRIKGKETYIPGITIKTLIAIAYVYKHYNFDYLVRTNISSIVNWNLLEKSLIDNPVYYGGSWVIKGFWGRFPYASGTSIILSRKAVKYMINHLSKIDTSLIDDVAIGKFFHNARVKLQWVGDTGINIRKKNPKTIVYRNKRKHRSKDVEVMQNIANSLLYY